MENWSYLLFISICSAVAVSARGQSTAWNDHSDDVGPFHNVVVQQLLNTVARLEAEMAELAARNEQLETDQKSSLHKITQLEVRQSSAPSGFATNYTSGVTYVRWGRTECPDNGATLLYSGHGAGKHHLHGGGGSNQLCLPQEPHWNMYSSTTQPTGSLYGINYYYLSDHVSFFSTVNNGDRSLHMQPASCAVCYVPQRSAFVMIPASTSCPVGWTMEYGGYLMSEHSYDDGSGRPRHATQHVCVDGAPEVATGGAASTEGVLVFVKARCGMLPCSKFPDGWELVCIVCTK